MMKSTLAELFVAKMPQMQAFAYFLQSLQMPSDLVIE